MSVHAKFESLESRQLLSVTQTPPAELVTAQPAHYVDVGYPASGVTILNTVNGKVIFTATDSNKGQHIYAYDPSTDSVTLLRDAIGYGGQVLDGFFYFGMLGNGEAKIVKTDGTLTGTTELPGDYDFEEPVVFKDQIYFSGDGIYVLDPKTDSIQTVSTKVSATFQGFTVVGNQIFFDGYDGLYPSNFTDKSNPNHWHGYEPWVIDGTSQSVHLVADINTKAPIAAEGSSYPHYFTGLNGLCFFTATDTKGKTSLYVSDGEQANAIMPATDVEAFGNAVYFISDGTLWKTDGTTTVALTDNEGFWSVDAGDNRLLVNGSNGIWTSDGTPQGTVPMQAFNGSDFLHFWYDAHGKTITNGNLTYFIADDGLNGLQIWQSDGTSAWTPLVTDSHPGYATYQASEPLLLGNQLFFTANTSDAQPPPSITTRGLWWVSTLNPPPPASPPPVASPVIAASVSNHVLNVNGTTGNDRITIRHKVGDGSILQVVVNGKITNFTFSDVQKINVTASNGNDFVDLRDIAIGATLLGGNGNDSIYGSDGADSINGNRGDDLLYGMAGNDSITGGIGHDIIRGGDGTDRLFALAGVDDLKSNKGDTIIKDVLG